MKDYTRVRVDVLPVSVFIGVIIGLAAFVAAFASPAPAEFVPGPGFDICTERGC